MEEQKTTTIRLRVVGKYVELVDRINALVMGRKTFEKVCSVVNKMDMPMLVCA